MKTSIVKSNGVRDSTEERVIQNWAAEYAKHELTKHREAVPIDHADGSVTREKLADEIRDEMDGFSERISAAESAVSTMREDIDAISYTKMDCFDFGVYTVSSGEAERVFMDVSTGIPAVGKFVEFTVDADCAAVALTVELFAQAVSPKIEIRHDFKAGHRYLAIVTENVSTASSTTGPSTIYAPVNGIARVVCDNGIFLCGGTGGGSDTEYILSVMRSERERVDELYTMLGYMVVDGGIFGMGDVWSIVDGGTFDDEPALIIDCGGFEARSILSAIKNNSVLDGGTY